MSNTGLPFIWDCHVCLPLDPRAALTPLDDHKKGGTNVVSINVGMDMNKPDQILRVIAAFTAKIEAQPRRYRLVGNIDDINNAMNDGVMGIYFDLEGSTMLQDMPEMIPLFHKLGVRQIHFAYNRNNSVASGCHDADTGLTELGCQMVRAVNHTGMIMDCSHMGKRASIDVMAASSKPVVFSHSNPRALCDHARCIDDEQIKLCAAQNGVIGLSGYNRFIGTAANPTPVQMGEQIDYVVQLVGIDHAGLGLDQMYSQADCSDFPDGVDNSYWWPKAFGYGDDGIAEAAVFSPLLMGKLDKELDRRGYSGLDRAKVFGLNFSRVAVSSW